MVDGSNPHRIVETQDWWAAKLSERFTLGHMQNAGDKVFAVMVAPK